MSFLSESISTGFGVDGVTIEQTLLNPYDPYSGMDINIGTFQNTNQGLEYSNLDGRIELGMFSFIDNNFASNHFPNILSAPFVGTTKRNLIKNGDCKFIEKNLLSYTYEDQTNDNQETTQVFFVQPENNWRFLSLHDYPTEVNITVQYENPNPYELFPDSLGFEQQGNMPPFLNASIPTATQACIELGYTGENNFQSDASITPPGNVYWDDGNQQWDTVDIPSAYITNLNCLTPDTNFDYPYGNPDKQGFLPYGGRYNYIPLSLEIDGSEGFNYWGGFEYIIDNWDIEGGWLEYMKRFQGRTITQQEIFDELSDEGTLNNFNIPYYYNEAGAAPHIASWIVSNEAYSNNRCLCFMNFQIWDKEYQYQYTVSPDGGKHIWNWFYEDDVHTNGEANEENLNSDNIKTENNQYRVLNQVQKIYDKFNDEIINPYSSLKIRFKMKTTLVFPAGDTISDADESDLFFQNPLDEDLGYAPQVEVGVLPSQWNETPKAGVNSLPDYLPSSDLEFLPSGKFNSTRYFNGETYEDKRYSPNGGQNRFQNSIMNEWETFEFNFNLTEDYLNRGKIYGVPYGGEFGPQGDDDVNQGEVEIMINHQATEGGLPTPQPAEIYFKVPGYKSTDTQIPGNQFYMISPSGESVSVEHGALGNGSYMTVHSNLGEDGGQSVGLQSDGRFLEAYLMYIGSLNLEMNSGLGYGQVDDNDVLTYPKTDMVVAYWDGERWSYDSNSGYLGTDGDGYHEYFTPNDDCFIIGRLYASAGNGITGFEQYIDNNSQYPTTGVGNLHLFLQSGNNFRGRVLIDDIECFESYEFTPEVDVRKKKSVGDYGSADLTKYYDREIEPEKYKDTQAPLEAQFYFYPQYPTNETFVERLPIYQDFKEGRFYIYDIDWDDGTPNEFTSEPEQINEEKALYHTYKTHGIFEVTGLMIRVKVNDKGIIKGVTHNKKFKLRININEGLDEDFQYFGSDGYSFIPFKNTVPIIGGISKQSNYYKSIKRQLGFLNISQIGETIQEGLRNIEVFINNNFEPLPDSYSEEELNQLLQSLSNLPFPEYIEEFDIHQNGVIDTDLVDDRTQDEILWFDSNDSPNAGRPDIRDLLQRLRIGIGLDDSLYIYPDYVYEWNSISDIKYSLIPNSKISIEFKNRSDKLKTELALLKMENQYNSNLEVLPSYMIPRIVFGDSIPPYLLYMGPTGDPLYDTYNTLEWPGPDFNLFDDSDYPNFPAAPAEGIVSIVDNENILSTLYNPNWPGSGWAGSLMTLVTGNTYRFNVNVDEFYWDAIQSLTNPYNLLDYQTLVWPGTDLEINVDNIPRLIERIERSDGVVAAFTETPPPDSDGWVGNLLTDGLEMEKEYMFQLSEGIGIYWPILPDTYVEPDKIIYNGISPIKEELGKGIGDCDLTNIKYYNEPKSIWELFGFEGGDLGQIGTPDNSRYWKNIIPKGYSIFNRDGITGDWLETNRGDDGGTGGDDGGTGGDDDGSGDTGNDGGDDGSSTDDGGTDINYGFSIDIYSEQDWLNGYYYPVLPRYGADGKFIEGDFPNNNIPFSLEGSITDENESDKNLLINIVNEKNDVEVFNDNSGNNNYGFSIEDYKTKFDNKTLRVEKNKKRSIFKTSKRNGAF